MASTEAILRCPAADSSVDIRFAAATEVVILVAVSGADVVLLELLMIAATLGVVAGVEIDDDCSLRISDCNERLVIPSDSKILILLADVASTTFSPFDE